LGGKPGRIRLALLGALAALLAVLGLASSAQASFPGVNGKIVFERPGTGIWALNPDGTQLPLTTDTSDGDPAVAPDGVTLAFQRDVNSRRNEVWVREADGSEHTISNTENVQSDTSHSPVFSPDGETVAYWKGGIVLSNRDGTGQRRLFTTRADGIQKGGSDPTFSPDGSKIAYAIVRGGLGAPGGPTNTDIWVIDSNDVEGSTLLGSTQRQLTEDLAADDMPSFSPDGSKIVFRSLRDQDSGTYEIYVMNADGSDERRLTTSTASDGSPVFSPDGTKIVFQSTRDYPLPQVSDTFVMNADGSGIPMNVAKATKLPDWGRVPGSSAPPPTASIGNATVTEGDSGQVDATFTVSLSAAPSSQATVAFSTANDSATAPGDYDSQSGTVSFAAGETSKTVTVKVNGDAIDEPDERFFVNLSSPTNVTIGDGQGAGTITDNDDPPAVSVGDASVSEGDSGQVDETFTVSLSAPSGRQVTASFATADDSALAPGDYDATSGTVTFLPGETSKTVTVKVNGDTIDELDERFFVNLSSPTNATIGDGQGVGTIVDNDPSGGVPAVSIGDATVTEGTGGQVDATFTVSLSAASASEVRVDFVTANDSAVAPGDYDAKTGTVTFGPGATSRTVTVQVNGDTLDEPDERFFVNLSNPQGATIGDGQGAGTIVDDDGPPAVSIGDASVSEGDAGQVVETFTVSLSAPSGRQVTASFATADDSALAPGDYEATTGTVTLLPGETSKTVTVKVNGDTIDEPDERFFVNLSSPTNATIGDGQGVGTIVDNDAEPALLVDDVAVGEGNAGEVDANVTLSLSRASSRVVSVDVQSQDDTAVASGDYTAKGGTVTFAPGETSKSVTFKVNGDTIDEPDERFLVNLSNPQNATAPDPQGAVTIRDDDEPAPPALAPTGAAPAEAAPVGARPLGAVPAPAGPVGAGAVDAPVPPVDRCLEPGGVGPPRVALARPGVGRARQRELFGGALLSTRGGIDRYCISGARTLRIGYPTAALTRGLPRSEQRRIRGRAVLVLTNSDRYGVGGIKPGSRVAALRRSLSRERAYRSGASLWYLAPAPRGQRYAFRTRAGRVLEVGLADRRLTGTPRQVSRLLGSWRL